MVKRVKLNKPEHTQKNGGKSLRQVQSELHGCPIAPSQIIGRIAAGEGLTTDWYVEEQDPAHPEDPDKIRIVMDDDEAHEISEHRPEVPASVRAKIRGTEPEEMLMGEIEPAVLAERTKS